MRFLRATTEAEMIAEFLRQEYASAERYRARILQTLREENADPHIITSPNINDDFENDIRRRILGLYRGYGIDRPSFLTGFPSRGVDWKWIALTPDELFDSRYILYEFWTQLSGGTRSPRQAAIRLRESQKLTEPGQDGERARILALVQALRKGSQMPPLIFVSADDGETRVVLEGHTRLTAYAMVPEILPNEIEALLGVSPDIANWDEY